MDLTMNRWGWRKSSIGYTSDAGPLRHFISLFYFYFFSVSSLLHTYTYFYFIHIEFLTFLFLFLFLIHLYTLLCSSCLHDMLVSLSLYLFSSSTIWWSVWSGLLTSRPMLTSSMLKIKQGILNQSLCFACVGPYNFGGHLSVTSVWPDWSVRATKFYGQVGWYLKWIWPLILTP